MKLTELKTAVEVFIVHVSIQPQFGRDESVADVENWH